MKNIVAIMLASVAWVNPSMLHAQKLDLKPKIQDNYYWGLAAGVFPGFGLGHAVRGRYFDSKAPVFTAGEAVSGAIMVSGLFYGGVPLFDTLVTPVSHEQMLGLGLFVGGAVLFAGLKIWEIADLAAMTIPDDLSTPRNIGLEGPDRRARFGAPNHDSTQALGIILHW